MALIQCPECSGQISDKAIICPHCGFPVRNGSISTSTPRKARKRRPNGSGTVVKRFGQPFGAASSAALHRHPHFHFGILSPCLARRGIVHHDKFLPS